MRTTTFKCDAPGCGKEHTPNNGFYLLKRDGRWLLLGAWDEREDLDKYEHYCGSRCLFERISALTGKEL